MPTSCGLQFPQDGREKEEETIQESHRELKKENRRSDHGGQALTCSKEVFLKKMPGRKALGITSSGSGKTQEQESLLLILLGLLCLSTCPVDDEKEEEESSNSAQGLHFGPRK